jgi:hypothetical protein
MTTTPLTDQQLADIEALIARTTPLGAATASPGMAAALLAEIRRQRALAADATEYRVHTPENGGTTLLVRRQALAHGTGWAVSTMAPGGGRAWTSEGWQEAISALSVDRLFCWPDAATAIAEARTALAA